MSVIRFNPDDVFTTDSSEYEVLVNGVRALDANTKGGVVEIGTRRGGSARMIIDTLVSTGQARRPMFCIDPYGNIEIACTNLNMSVHYPGTKVQGDPHSKEITSKHTFDYTNKMRDRVIPSLYYYGYAAGVNFQFFQMEDWEFFDRFEHGVPVYDDGEGKSYVNQYAFVFFDGPHTNEAIQTELDFFLERTTVGSIFVFDDIWMVNHDEVVEERLFKLGWETLEKKKIKASYKKVK